jgi:8-oxo-dGTP diphosphatase
MLQIKEKAFCYITNRARLLVFNHPDFPEAGIQVPGGTIEPGEDPAEAAMREAREETGLNGFVLHCHLGVMEVDQTPYGKPEVHRRHFYHLEYLHSPPETWRHGEMHPSDGSPAPIFFDFFWAPLPNQVPELIAGQGEFLPSLAAEGGIFDQGDLPG